MIEIFGRGRQGLGTAPSWWWVGFCALWQSARVDLADELPQALVQVAAGAVEIEHRRRAAGFGEQCEARAVSGAAQHVLQLLALRDKARRVGLRPRDHERHIDRG